MKRMILAAAIAGGLGGGAALAADEVHWSVPGWYQVSDSMFGIYIEKGPFDSKEACEPTLPKSDEDLDYECKYLSEKPKWDY
jgi:hypothetical protein